MKKLDRREFLRVAAAGMGAVVASHPMHHAAAGARLNVLHIISDDLAACLGCYGHPLVKTPNLDRLAANGVRFDRAYCQFPLCNPSRASFMTGIRPDVTRAYKNQTNFREALPDVRTIPQSFMKAGYRSARVGKIYHYGVPGDIGTSGMDDPASWEKAVNPRGRDVDDIGLVEVPEIGPDGTVRTVTGKQLRDTGAIMSWLAADGTDEEQTDGMGALAAVELLKEFSSEEKPFYLAVGFYRPHTPDIAPKTYFDMYPLDAITPPAYSPAMDKLFPPDALASRRPEESGLDETLRKKAIQSYYATITFMDAQVGRLLDALESLNLKDTTVVVFHSDHGYHLGEKNLWRKMSLFEQSARVPLIISVPGNAANGLACSRPVELVSLHRTLTALCGIDPEPRAQGHSLQPLVKDPEAPWEHAAFTQVIRSKRGSGETEGPRMGRSVRTERWRYTEWDGGAAGAELYDHDQDPEEMNNVAKPASQNIVEEMKALLGKMGS